MKKVISYNFSEIKRSYFEVIDFLSRNGIEVNSLDEKIAEDYHYWGDDNEELLYNFIEEFNLDYSDFVYEDHFESEVELFNIWTSLLTSLFIPYWFVVFTLNHLLSIEITLYSPKFVNPRIDLTVGDIIIWKINRKFILRNQGKLIYY